MSLPLALHGDFGSTLNSTGIKLGGDDANWFLPVYFLWQEVTVLVSPHLHLQTKPKLRRIPRQALPAPRLLPIIISDQFQGIYLPFLHDNHQILIKFLKVSLSP